MKHLEHSCEEIDASVFSGDLLYEKGKRDMLKSYIARWSRAIADHELNMDDDDDASDEEPCPACFCRGCNGECMGDGR